MADVSPTPAPSSFVVLHCIGTNFKPQVVVHSLSDAEEFVLAKTGDICPQTACPKHYALDSLEPCGAVAAFGSCEGMILRGAFLANCAWAGHTDDGCFVIYEINASGKLPAPYS